MPFKNDVIRKAVMARRNHGKPINSNIKIVKTKEGFEVQEYGQAISFPHLSKKGAEQLKHKLTANNMAGRPLT